MKGQKKGYSLVASHPQGPEIEYFLREPFFQEPFLAEENVSMIVKKVERY